MYNKKVLSEATKNLDKTKAPAKKKDIITDPMGQWNHPGKDTRIPGNDITMQGVPYPVWAQPNVGAPQMMYPGQDYQFPGADYVDEFPQNEDYYEDDLTDDEINELKAGGYIVEDISIPQLTKAQFGTANVPTEEETQFAQRSTKGIPYADKEITLPEVRVTPAGYKGPTNLNNPNALLSPQQRTLAQGKGPLQTGNVNSYNKPASDKQWKRQQAKDKLIRSGVAAEMYPKYFDQDLMGIQEPVELGEIMDYDADINQNAEDARYRIWKRNEERAYQNAGYGDRFLNELQSFTGDPLGQVSRAVSGKRSLMGQGYRDIAGENYNDTRFYNRANDRSRVGLIGSTLLNVFNPMQYAGRAGYDITKNNYTGAAANLGNAVLSGAGSGLTKSQNLKNLFNTQMAVESAQSIPETVDTFFDPNLDPYTKGILMSMNLGFLRSGARTLKPGLKSVGQNIKALAPKQTLPQLSYKKGGEKKFSRSLEAKNKLFAENVFLKKKKSKKRKIFDPNAKYYQDGGVSPLEGNYLSKVIMNRNRGTDFVDRAYALGANPGTPIFNVPDDEQFGAYMSHKMAYGEDDSGKTWMFPTVLNPNNEAIEVPGQYADYISSEGYKYATGMKQKGGFQDDLGKHRQLIRDWTYGQSIGMLQEKQLGGQQYRYEGRKDAVYTKDTKGNWLIKSPGTKMQWQLVDDPTGKRTTLLNKQAIPLDNIEKVGMNEGMMNKVHADRYANKIKNLRNEVKTYNNELKYEPEFDVPVSESTRVDASLLPASVKKEKQDIALQKRTKAERIKSIEAYLKGEQEEQKQAAYDRSTLGKFEAEQQAKLDSYRRSSGRAAPVDWVWTLPLAAAKAPKIISAIGEAGTLLDVPATIGGREIAKLTAGNVLRGYTALSSGAQLPNAFTNLSNAKTTDEKLSATRDVLHNLIGTSPLLKWENALYNTLSVPLTFADNTRRYASGEKVDPISGTSNILRTARALTGRKEGGEMYEDEIDDETRKQLEALGYIIEDLD